MIEMDKIYQGDTLATMKTWPAAFVQTCVTSPPYFGLRDYGHEGQVGRRYLGCELNPDYVKMAEERITNDILRGL